MQVGESAKAFLAACEHVDGLWKKARVFVTGNNAFWELLQRAELKEVLDEAINRAGGGGAVKYVSSTLHLRESLPVLCFVLLHPT
jgi:hypothetical protein